MDFLDIRIIDIVDIVLVAFLLYYVYKLVKGTVAINIFVGIVIIYGIWRLTELLEMELLSKILGGFLGVGMFALIVVFQQEIRKFLLMLGSTNFNARRRFFKKFREINDDANAKSIVDSIISAIKNMSATNTGALIVFKKKKKNFFFFIKKEEKKK